MSYMGPRWQAAVDNKGSQKPHSHVPHHEVARVDLAPEGPGLLEVELHCDVLPLRGAGQAAGVAFQVLFSNAISFP